LAQTPDTESNRPTWFSDIPAILWTIGLGAVGGYLFYLWRMPLAWMIGSMCMTTVLALAGLPLKGSRRLRNVVIPVLGLMLGSAFTPDVVGNAALWLPSLTALVVFMAVTMSTVFWFFYRVVGMGAISSYFSSTPGGLATMTIIAQDFGADERTVALTHSVRILLTVMIIPFWFKLFVGYEPGTVTMLGTFSDIGFKEVIVLALCAVIGYAAAHYARLPSPFLLGPLIATAIVHLTGTASAKPPTEIVNIAQVIIGSGIGARFSGVRLTRVFKVFASATVSTVFMVGLAAAFAAVLHHVTGLPFESIWLCFAPGGLAEMSLISLALEIDPAMVSTHHLLRIAVMVFSAPILFKFLRSRFHIEGDTRHPAHQR